MNAYKKIIIFFLLLITNSYCQAGLLDYFKTAVPTENLNKVRLPLGINERTNQLEHLKLELKDLHATDKDFTQSLQVQLDQTDQQIKEIKAVIYFRLGIILFFSLIQK